MSSSRAAEQLGEGIPHAQANPPHRLGGSEHKVLQILVNLIRNAKHACDAADRPHRLLTVRVAPGGRGVQIAVIDNGIGIAPEHMSRIFNHGFTTKKEGHGFGLHSGALAAKELGGELRVESLGVDRGATFVLDLPTGPRADRA
jgi:signal transduction histidine kinase